MLARLFEYMDAEIFMLSEPRVKNQETRHAYISLDSWLLVLVFF